MSIAAFSIIKLLNKGVIIFSINYLILIRIYFSLTISSAYLFWYHFCYVIPLSNKNVLPYARKK